MAYNPNEQFNETTGLGSQLRAFPKVVQPKTFASGSGTLAKLTPVAFNDTSRKWVPWSGKLNEISTITKTGTVSGGDYTLTVQGETTAAIAYNANAATIQAALLLLGVIDSGDVVVTDVGGGATGGGSTVLTFGGKFAEGVIVVSLNGGGLTGGGSYTLTETQAGKDQSGVRGFIWPDDVVLDSDEEVLGQVMLEGIVHYDDIVLPAGEVEATLKLELQDHARDRGLTIQGLIQVH